MKKYHLLLFLCMLPTICTSRVVKKRRRPAVDQHQRSILDQIAQANTWQSPNRVISASYLQNPGTGHVNNANLMINLIPHQEQHHSVDLAASKTLSNAQSAAEYVTRALQMRKNLHDKAPHSSYVKYDIYEKEQMKHLRPSYDRRLVTQNPNTKSDSVTRTSKIYEDYRKPDYSNDFGEGEYMYKESNHNYNGHHDSHVGDSYDNFKNDMKSLTDSGIPKAELMKHIEKSVVRYMKRLESEGGLPNKATTSRPHTEIKTYYRLPKLNSEERIKDFTEYRSTESELFKPSPTQHYKTYKSPNKATYTTVSTPYPQESHTSVNVVPNIDLTFRSKRPKPIDYSALDIGQSWSHGSSLDQSAKKPKLKFNSQTYQDINAMTYAPDKGLIQVDQSYPQADIYPCTSTESGYYGGTVRDGVVNVGSSITVREKHLENSNEAIKDLQDHYRKPLQIINGVPVINPYKLNVDTLKHMFGDDPEEIPKNNWQPYEPSDNRHKQPQKETASASNVHDHRLPYDSYNPKYNNNPEGQGYQDHWQPSDDSHRQRGTIGSDMHSSSSSTLPKKIRNTTTVTIHKHKRKKNKTKRIIIGGGGGGKKKNNLQTELRPPPAQSQSK